MQPHPYETEDRHQLSIDFRPAWTGVSLGQDFAITVCTVSGAILVTRTSGFPTGPDIDRYCEFIKGVMSEGLNPDQPYIHVMELSGLKGATLEARNRFMNFLQSQSQLRGVVVCGISAFMRMNINLAQRQFPFSFPLRFCPDLDHGIHLAGQLLQISFPEYFEWPSNFLVSLDQTPHPKTHIALVQDGAVEHAAASFRLALSDQHTLVFSRIGSRILLCRLKGSTSMASLDPSLVIKARRQAAHHCLPDQSLYVEIWDATNLKALLGRMAIVRLFKALFKDRLPLLGCFILDIGCHIRFLVRWCLWRQRPPYPVECQASLTMTILQAREILQTSGYEAADEVPRIMTKPEWHHGDKDYYAENEIIDRDIVHSIGTGFLQRCHVGPQVRIQRQLAMEIYSSGYPYYLLTGMEMLRGASYKARKHFIESMCKLYRDYPFQMYVFYGATGRTLAGINLGKYQVPYRVMLADDLQSALAIIRADKLRRTYLGNPENGIAEGIRPPAAAAVFKRYVDDILQYLASLNWEPDGQDIPPPAIDAHHPFAQVFEAIELIRDDIRVLFLEQHKASQEQRNLEKQLERSKKMAALGLLAGGVAHDLNNVLSGLLTYPDVLLMEVPKHSPLWDPLNVIRKSGEQAAAVVQDLLVMARRGVTKTIRLNFNALIEEYLNSPEHRSLRVRYPMIGLQTELNPDVLEIRGSPVHLKKALMNLVSNAFEAGQTSGSVKLRSENRCLDRPIKGYDTVAAGFYVVIEVIDRGNGIAEKDLPHIFEPFYTRKAMGRSGTGLGMAVVWGTVQDHKGYIDIQTKVGQGTTFSLFFPACGELKPGHPAAAVEDRPGGDGESILVVDDLAAQRQIARAVLEHLGYRVETADSGEAALEFLDRCKADLVVLDMVMEPGMDGLETIQQIRKHHPHQKIILVSGHAENKRVKQAQSLGAEAFIKKPYTIQTLAQALRRALE